MIRKKITNRLAVLSLCACIVMFFTAVALPSDTQAVNQPSLADVYRFWSDTHQAHFYTINETERDFILQNYAEEVWASEGAPFQAYEYLDESCPADTYPVHRFWSDLHQTHFYTIDETEKSLIESLYPEQVWRYEGVAFCAAKEASETFKPVGRFWSDTNQAHFFTISIAESNHVKANYPDDVWRYESVAFYAAGDPGISTPEPVDYLCPVYNNACIPCTAGEQYCRVEDGKTEGFLGWSCQNNNPGNIRYSEYRNGLITSEGGTPACGERGTFMVFATPVTGFESLKAYVKAIAAGSHVSYPECGNCSLKYFFSKYAPAEDQNDPESYANIVASQVGVDADTTTLNWIVANKLSEFASAIKQHEGWFEF